MDSKKKQEEIFKAAIQIENPAERDAYVKDKCGKDSELQTEVESLLQAYFDAGDFLESPVMGVNVTLDDDPLLEGPNSIIGPYKILKVLGEGGCGVVYLAEQKKPIERRVALKVIKPGMDTKRVLARFEAERQALALLDHPNIAKIHDAGATGAGRPYFVMELVKGVTITEHCDRHMLTIEQRLELFGQVCDAIQHAHQKGIIHRDIKPSNVLVVIEGGKAVPKVIDFGVAKAISQKLTERTLFTEQGQIIGTPEYMSPEQAEMTAQDIDTRSDIYSLGVLLYELLTGALPFDPKSLREAAFQEIQRIIREENPPHPSTKLSSLGEEGNSVAKKRHTELTTLTRRLHKELEWIPLMALRKDRQQRYQSASEFAKDVQNYLDGSPLIAGPESATYRLQKFVRRNRTLVTSATLIFIVLVAGIISSTMFAVWALNERDMTKQAQEETNQILQELLNGYPFAVMPFTYTGGGDLDYLSMGIPDMLQQSLSYLPKLRVSPFESVWTRYGEDPLDPALVGDEFNVKVLITGEIETQGNNLTVQIRIVNTKEGKSIYTQIFKEELKDLASIPTNIAKDFADLLNIQLTEEQAQRAFKVATNSPEAFQNYMMGRRLTWLRVANNVAQAIEYFEMAIDLDPEFAKAYAGLAEAHFCNGTYASEPHYIWIPEATKAANTALQLDDDLAEAHTALSGVLRQQLLLGPAQKECERALELNPNYVLAHHWLGMCFWFNGNTKKAIECAQNALELDPANIIVNDKLAEYYLRTDQKEEGVKQLLKSVELNPQSTYALNHAANYMRLYIGDLDQAIALREKAASLSSPSGGNWYRLLGQYEKAITEIKKVIEIKPLANAPYSNLQQVFIDSERRYQAIEIFKDLSKQYPQSPYPLMQLGIAYRNIGNYEPAIKYHQDAIQLAPKDPQVYAELGLTYKAKDDYENAEEQLLKAIELGVSSYPSRYRLYLRDLYRKHGDIDKAIEYWESAVQEYPDRTYLYYSLGIRYRENYEYKKALDTWSKGLELVPEYGVIQTVYAQTLSYIGEHEDAIKQYHKILDSLPHKIVSNPNNSMAYRYYIAGDYPNAIVYFIKAVKFEPSGTDPIGNLSGAYLANEQYPEAAESFREYFRLKKIPNSDEIFTECFGAGEFNQSTLQSYLQKILETTNNSSNPLKPLEKSRYYAFCGHKEKALDMLDAAFEAKDTALTGDVWLFWYDDLHSEPDFQELIKKLNLDKYFYNTDE